MSINKYFEAVADLLNNAPEGLKQSIEFAADSSAGVMAGYFILSEERPKSKRPFKAGDAVKFVEAERNAHFDKINSEREARENAEFLLRSGDLPGQDGGSGGNAREEEL